MKTWIVEPRDTLIIRDGRPIQEGAHRMQSVDFPWPSTIAGFVRTRVGMNDRGVFMLDPKDARQIPVAGPWLVELDADGCVVDHYVPAPQDCIWHVRSYDKNHKPKLLERRRLSLMPAAQMEGYRTDLDGALQLVHCTEPMPAGKKPTSGPAFWKWDDVATWLGNAPTLSDELKACEFGLAAPIHERRFHVAIDEATQTAADEHLFSTDGLRFSTAKRKRLAVVFGCDDVRLREGLAMVGGERRISFLREAKGQKVLAPELPANFKVGSDRIARVVLLTPALFANGFAPEEFGPGATVIAAAVGRAEVVSGWDFTTNKPKATRRMAPAGSVYWVKLDPTVNVKTWAEGIWMKSVSDDPQDKRDGFGLAVVGVG